MDLKELDSKYLVSSAGIYTTVDPSEFKPTSEMKPPEGLARIVGHNEFVAPMMEALGSTRTEDNIVVIAPEGYGADLFVDLCIEHYRAHTTTRNIDQVLRQNFGNPKQPQVAYLTAGSARQLVDDLEHMVKAIESDMITYTFVEKYDKAELKGRMKERQELAKANKPVPDKLKERIAMLESPAKNDRARRELAELQKAYISKISTLEHEVMRELAEEGYDLKKAKEIGDSPVMRISYYIEKDGTRLDPKDWPLLYKGFSSEVSHLKYDYQKAEMTVERVSLIKKHIKRLKFRYRNNDEAVEMLIDFENYVTNHWDDFMPKKSIIPGLTRSESHNEFMVTVLQDNHGNETTVPYEEVDGASVHEFRGNEKLFGWDKEEHQKIVAGAFVRASSGLREKKGLLVVRNGDTLLMSPFMSRFIFRALQDGKVKPVALAGEINPEPALANTKVVMPLTHRYSHHFLTHEANKHLANMFQRRLVLPTYMANNEDNRQEIARHFRDSIEQHDLKHATPDAIAKVIEYQMSRRGKRKLDLNFEDLVDVYTRANFRAEQSGSDTINAEHVEKAFLDRDNERNITERNMHESANEYFSFPTEKAVGEVGGLSVYVAGHMFGKPFRISVQAVQNEGRGLRLIDRDKNADLAGRMAIKGKEEIESLLKMLYHTPDTPLNFDLHIGKSQEHGPHDGPSGSIAYAVACISAIADIPVYPNVYFTGALNPGTGESVPIGGLNYKIMGVVDFALDQGWQDTIIGFPARNRNDLQLINPKYRKAVEEGKVRLYSYANIDEALEIATRVSAEKIHKHMPRLLKNLELEARIADKDFSKQAKDIVDPHIPWYKRMFGIRKP